jgi:hypothetical protein
MQQLAAGKNDLKDLLHGLHPDWGPFGALGSTGKTVIDALMAGGLLVCIGRAIVGAAKIKAGQSEYSHDPIAVQDGRKLMFGGMIGAFLIASMATLFTIVYGMGI